MLEYTLDTEQSILHLHPRSRLEADDFLQITKTIDPYIEANGNLAGILIETPNFPGWDSLGAMAAHLRFVHDHHRHIKKVALVTDSALGDVAEHFAAHFVAAEIKHFAASEAKAAEQWITG